MIAVKSTATWGCVGLAWGWCGAGVGLRGLNVTLAVSRVLSHVVLGARLSVEAVTGV